MFSKRLFILFACMIFVVFAFQSHAPAEVDRESMTVTTDGVASIDGGDYAKSRDNAIRAALEGALAVVVEAEGLGGQNVEDGGFPEVTLMDDLYGNPSAYVSEYRIIEESSDGDQYRVVMAANVLKGRIIAELESRKEGAPPGRTMVSADRSADSVLVRASGIRSISQYHALRQYLAENLDCVASVYPRTFQFQSAEFDVRLKERQDGCLERKLAVAEVPGVPIVLRSSSDREIELEVLTWSR